MTVGTYIVLSIIACAVTGATAQDRRLTIPEILRRQAPEPLLQTRQSELMPKTLEEIAPITDLIVHGTIATANAYLSEDQSEVYTDYTIVPLRVLLQRNMQTSRLPGTALPIVVKRWGGQTVVNGVQVTVEDLDLRWFRPGEEVLLFLAYNKSEGKFQLAGGSGAFSIHNNGVQPLVRHPRYERFSGMTVDQLDSEVRRLSP